MWSRILKKLSILPRTKKEKTPSIPISKVLKKVQKIETLTIGPNDFLLMTVPCDTTAEQYRGYIKTMAKTLDIRRGRILIMSESIRLTKMNIDEVLTHVAEKDLL